MRHRRASARVEDGPGLADDSVDLTNTAVLACLLTALSVALVGGRHRTVQTIWGFLAIPSVIAVLVSPLICSCEPADLLVSPLIIV